MSTFEDEVAGIDRDRNFPAEVRSRIAANLADGSQPEGAALKATIAEHVEEGGAVIVAARAGRNLRPNGNRVAFIGTSLSSLYRDANAVYPPHRFPSWPNRLCWESGGRMINAGYFAVPGATTQQIHDTQIPQVLAMSPLPAACYIECGANDAAAGASATFKALVTSMVDQLQAVGIVPILVLSPHRGEAGSSGSTVQIGTGAQNEWRIAFADRRGLLTFDAYSAIVDITGGIAAAYTIGDTTHLNEAGYARIAAAAAEQGLPGYFPAPRGRRGRSKADPSDLWAGRGVFNGSAQFWAGLKTGTSEMTLGLASPAVGEDVSGQWLTGTRSAGTGDAVLQGPFIPAGNLPALSGRRVAMVLPIKTTGLLASGGSLDVALRFNATTSGDVFRVVAQAITRDLTGMLYIETTIPAGVSGTNGANVVITTKAPSGGATTGPIVISVGSGKIIDLDLAA